MWTSSRVIILFESTVWSFLFKNNIDNVGHICLHFQEKNKHLSWKSSPQTVSYCPMNQIVLACMHSNIKRHIQQWVDTPTWWLLASKGPKTKLKSVFYSTAIPWNLILCFSVCFCACMQIFRALLHAKISLLSPCLWGHLHVWVNVASLSAADQFHR